MEKKAEESQNADFLDDDPEIPKKGSEKVINERKQQPFFFPISPKNNQHEKAKRRKSFPTIEKEDSLASSGMTRDGDRRPFLPNYINSIDQDEFFNVLNASQASFLQKVDENCSYHSSDYDF
jgi:hypothetical protein